MNLGREGCVPKIPLPLEVDSRGYPPSRVLSVKELMTVFSKHGENGYKLRQVSSNDCKTDSCFLGQPPSPCFYLCIAFILLLYRQGWLLIKGFQKRRETANEQEEIATLG